ncbi:MAG TPA: arginase [Planctomycetota bacterium]|nr:arginase [Planctomycetota bacterium]
MKRKNDAPRIGLIGVPMDLGTHLRGVDMGPSAIRVAGINAKLASLGYRVHDRGNVSVTSAHAASEAERKSSRLSSPRSKSLCFAPLVARVCSDLSLRVEKSLDNGEIPLVLGGDHSIAMGTLGGLARHAKKHGKKFGLLWVDAHGDCNTVETSPSGNIHGMPMAVALGHGPRLLTGIAGVRPMMAAARTVLMGARDLDLGERANIKRFGIHVYTMRQLDERGVFECVREALQILTDGTDGFHLSFDIDSVDPSVAPGVGTPVSGGLTIREAHLIMELIADSRAMRSCELVEVNPALDVRNTTAHLASELLMSAFGASIL